MFFSLLTSEQSPKFQQPQPTFIICIFTKKFPQLDPSHNTIFTVLTFQK